MLLEKGVNKLVLGNNSKVLVSEWVCSVIGIVIIFFVVFVVRG